MEYTLEQKIEILRGLYSSIKKKIKTLIKTDKKTYKKICNNLESELDKRNEKFVEIGDTNIDYFSLSYDFLWNILEQNLFRVRNSKIIDIDCFKRDKDFMIYFKNILIFTNHLEKNPFLYTKMELFVFCCFFKDISSLVLSYFIIKEKNITYPKIMSVLSLFLKGSTITTNPLHISEEIDKKIYQITTSIKYEKDKPLNNDNYDVVRNYTKSNTFNLLGYLSNRITIKYVTKKEYKHMFHKRPREHIRSRHKRVLPNGNEIWIEESIINKGLVS